MAACFSALVGNEYDRETPVAAPPRHMEMAANVSPHSHRLYPGPPAFLYWVSTGSRPLWKQPSPVRPRWSGSFCLFYTDYVTGEDILPPERYLWFRRCISASVVVLGTCNGMLMPINRVGADALALMVLPSPMRQAPSCFFPQAQVPLAAGCQPARVIFLSYQAGFCPHAPHLRPHMRVGTCQECVSQAVWPGPFGILHRALPFSNDTRLAALAVLAQRLFRAQPAFRLYQSGLRIPPHPARR